MDSLENGKQKAGKEAFFSRERTSFPQNFRTHGVRSRARTLALTLTLTNPDPTYNPSLQLFKRERS
eukprot:1393015-Amorphochlora_amoeboformis.AAC.2